jgi:hypothetical protein
VAYGANGTPDLIDQFVVGAGDSFAIGDSAASEALISTTTANVLAATIPPQCSISGNCGIPMLSSVTASDFMPDYFALAYIVKL